MSFRLLRASRSSRVCTQTTTRPMRGILLRDAHDCGGGLRKGARSGSGPLTRGAISAAEQKIRASLPGVQPCDAGRSRPLAGVRATRGGPENLASSGAQAWHCFWWVARSSRRAPYTRENPTGYASSLVAAVLGSRPGPSVARHFVVQMQIESASRPSRQRRPRVNCPSSWVYAVFRNVPEGRAKQWNPLWPS